jgi:hypothetical protein
MKSTMQPCEFETLVVRAVRTGAWSDDLRAHFASCPICADAAVIAEALSAEPSEATAVPAVGLVWWKAQLRRRLEMQERALRPLVWAERAAIAAGIAGAVWTSAWAASSNPALAFAVVGALAAGAAAGSLLWALARR